VELMTHVLTLLYEHDGMERWYCPTCGRLLVLRWEPWYRRVIALGDEAAAHSGGKGGLVMGVEVKQ
jgi:hypothetical protein